MQIILLDLAAEEAPLGSRAAAVCAERTREEQKKRSGGGRESITCAKSLLSGGLNNDLAHVIVFLEVSRRGFFYRGISGKVSAGGGSRTGQVAEAALGRRRKPHWAGGGSRTGQVAEAGLVVVTGHLSGREAACGRPVPAGDSERRHAGSGKVWIFRSVVRRRVGVRRSLPP